MSAERRELLDGGRTDWKMHNCVYVAALPLLLLRMRFARERWLRRTLLTLLTQWGVSSATELARVMESRLFTESGNPCSLIYIGFSLTTKRPYIGMVEDRLPIARFMEHWKCTVNHRENNVDEVDWKYQFMAKTGAWDWYFLPLVVCTGTIAKARLRSLERTILLSYPNALNFEARRHFNRVHRPAISNPRVSRHVGLAMNFNDRPRSLRNRKVVTDIGYIDSMGQQQLTVDPATAFAN